MASRIHSLGSCLIVLTLLLFAGSASAQDVSPRCEAAMDRAAGEYGRCLLRADAHNARHENATKLENRQARCETRFERHTSRAVSRHGADECPSSDLVAAMADRVESFAGGVKLEASGAAGLELLFVQSAESGSLTETELRLTGVSEKVSWFSSRPYRDAGSMSTERFVAAFSEDVLNSLEADPPNAQFVCEKGGERKSAAVSLMDPVLTGDNLVYSVTIISSEGEDTLLEAIACESDANLFIDSKSGSPKHATIPAGYTTAELVKNHCFASGFCNVIANPGGSQVGPGSHLAPYLDATVENTGCSTTSAGTKKWNWGHTSAQKMLKDHSYLVFIVGMAACNGPSTQ